MEDTISRKMAIDASKNKNEHLKTDQNAPFDEFISRKAAIEAHYEYCNKHPNASFPVWSLKILEDLPSAQPFHNITMDDVLKYIDRMPEDVWQEFTACLECRGWELQRITAKWCGSEFA